jgi:hypothetical protein
MNFVVNNEEHFQQNSAIQSFNTKTGTIFTDQLLTYHAFRKMHTIQASKYSAVCHQISEVLRKNSHNLK